MKQRHSGRNKTKQKPNTNLKQISFMRSVNSTSQVFVHKEFSLCLCLCPAPLSLVSFYLFQKKFDIAELLMSLYWCVENVVLLLSKIFDHQTSKVCEALLRGSTRDQQVRGSPQCRTSWEAPEQGMLKVISILASGSFLETLWKLSGRQNGQSRDCLCIKESTQQRSVNNAGQNVHTPCIEN